MKTVLVTGAGSGIGRAVAEKFASAGWQLIVTGLREENLNALKEDLPVPVIVLVQDIAEVESISKDLNNLPKEFQNIDVLVSNAGIALGKDKSQVADFNNWIRMVDVNIKGLLGITHAVLPRMVANRKGHIINISSVTSYQAYAGGNVYAASKAFNSHFTRCLNTDLVGTGIKTTFIEPWKTRTNFSLSRYKGDRELAEKQYSDYKCLEPEDVAEAVYWSAMQPAHVNVLGIEITSVDQTFGGIVNTTNIKDMD